MKFMDIHISSCSFQMYSYHKGTKNLTSFMIHYMHLALVSWKKEGCDGFPVVIKSSFLSCFFLVFVIPCVWMHHYKSV